MPRSEFRGNSFAEMSAVLSRHLRRQFGSHGVRDCGSFEVADLLLIQAELFRLAEPELLRIFEAAAPIRATGKPDGRKERHASAAALESHWMKLLESTSESMLPVLRDGLCHDVVMRFAHHTTEASRAQLTANPKFVLPALPSKKHQHDGRVETVAAFEEYEAMSGCQACHSRLVPPPSSPVAASCATVLSAKCGKRGQLIKDKCTACIQEHSEDLSVCSATESTEWCDHPDACIGADECPVWPVEFAAPFGLHATIPPIDGAKSTFYYKYTAEIQAQTVDYYEKCFPFVNLRTPFSNLPCKLIFKPNGIYLSQPGRVQCCKFVGDVGAVPPEFLQSFKRTAQDEEALDMVGNKVKCDRWEGPDGFKYWTVGHNDAIYKNFGHDILFQDGPTGVTWRWGNFSVAPQANSLFDLPDAGDGHSCEDSCPKFLSSEELEALALDSHVARAKQHASSGRIFIV